MIEIAKFRKFLIKYPRKREPGGIILQFRKEVGKSNLRILKKRRKEKNEFGMSGKVLGVENGMEQVKKSSFSFIMRGRKRENGKNEKIYDFLQELFFSKSLKHF